MPLYLYSCEVCEMQLEVLQRRKDEEPPECPCCTADMVKQVSSAAFSLKGGGWYKDLYSSTPKTTDKR